MVYYLPVRYYIDDKHVYIFLGLPHSSDISITSQCLTHLTISWTSDSDELTTCGPVTYNVKVSHYDRVIQTVTVKNTSITLSGLVPATNYTITIYTTNNAGYSVTSTTATTAGRKCVMCFLLLGIIV